MEAEASAIIPSWWFDVPTFYAEGVANVARSGSVAKFYFYSIDPVPTHEGSDAPRFVAQIAMPIEQFVQTTVFFESVVQGMIDKGEVTKEKLASLRAAYSVPETEGKEPIGD
jgi:hypothetical protein